MSREKDCRTTDLYHDFHREGKGSERRNGEKNEGKKMIIGFFIFLFFLRKGEEGGIRSCVAIQFAIR